jgi:hypothetical protein
VSVRMPFLFVGLLITRGSVLYYRWMIGCGQTFSVDYWRIAAVYDITVISLFCISS